MKKDLPLKQKAKRILCILFMILLASDTSLIYAKSHDGKLNARLNILFNNDGLLNAVQKLAQSKIADFAYDPADLAREHKSIPTLNFENATLEHVLSNLLENTNMRFREENGTIILYRMAHRQVDEKVTITVTDEKGDPLPGASVRIEEVKRTVGTDLQGRATLRLPAGSYTLIASYVSYERMHMPAMRVRAGIENKFTITMKSAMGSLNEVVVVGYGTQKRENLTGAVDQVKGEVLSNRPFSNINQGLQGMLPNLNITPIDGKPIQAPAMNIRGTTSIGQGGNALVLIDGVEGDPSRINPNDIESVSILKDAASAAIYGARGVFGVVLITTKSPSRERASVNYSFNQAIKSPTTVPEFVTNGYTFASMFNEAWSAWNDYSQSPQNINKTIRFSQEYLEELKRRDADPSLPKTELNSNGEYVYYANTDWMKELYKDHNTAADHNISVSGSNGKTDFYISGRYYNQNGLFRYNSDDYKTYNLRAKGSLEVFKWLKLSNNADYSSMNYFNPINVGEGGGIWRNIADEGHTNSPMFNPDGTLTYSAAYTVGDLWYGKNGIDMDRRVFRNTTSFATKFFQDQLRIKGDFTFQTTDNNEQRRRVQVPYSRKPGVIEYIGATTNDLQFTDRNTQYMATNIYAEYEPKLGKDHYVKVLAGFNNEQSTYKGLRVLRNGLIFENARDLNLALGQSITTGGGWEQWVVRGGFYRLNYAFKDRYLLEFNGRYDGSSKFPSNQRFAFFPSVSGGWRISNEPFWKVSPSAISDLKLRASYGSLGNGNIDSYMFQEKYAIVQSGRVLNGTRPQQTGQSNVLPAGLTWEKSTTLNGGLDIAFLSNRLNLTADAYIRKTTDMFTKGATLPAVFGTDVPKGNYADLETKGWEASISWNDHFDLASKPFHYNLRLSMADYTAKITKYNNAERNLTDYYEGQKIGEMWGFQTAGYFTSAADIANSPSQVLYKASTSGQLLPGDIKFADLNGDNVINNGGNTVGNPGDMRVIGNTSPRYTYGINLGADWNRFSFSAFFQGVGKRDWYPGKEAGIFWGQYNRPYNKIPTWQIGNTWSEENPNAYLPRYRGYVAQNGSGELAQNQTKYIQNAAYIRLKNIQVGYSLPPSLIKGIGMKNLQIFLSGENLWSWSPIYKLTKDLDVENLGRSDVVASPPDATSSDPNNNNSGNGNNYPILKSVSFGISANF